MAPLPSMGVTANLKEVLGIATAGELTESALSQARVTFVSNFPPDAWLRWGTSLYRGVAPVGYPDVRVNTAGNIVLNDDAESPVLLLAQDDGLNVRGLQWHVQVDIPSQVLPPSSGEVMRSWWFDAVADGATVDLKTTIPAVATPIAGVSPMAQIFSSQILDAGNVGIELIQSDDQADAWLALGNVPVGNLPNLALVQFKGSKANQAAMLATTGESGDWIIRTDTATTWIITGADPTQLSSWTQLPIPAVTWSNLSGRPAVVGAGADAAAARAAIDAVGNGDLTALGVTPELLQDFTIAPNGTPTTADTGQAWTRSYIDATNTPVIASGRFVSNGVNSGTGAAYLTAQLTGNVTYMEADFAFGAAGSTDTQVAAIIAWHTNLPSGAIGAVPDSPCHLIFGDTSYSYQVFSGGTNIPVATVNYSTARGTALQHVEVAIDAANSCAYVRGPDGVVTRFSHALIGSTTAQFACCEVFYTAANTNNRIAFSRFGASSLPLRAPNRGQLVKQDYGVVNGGVLYPTIGFMRDTAGGVILNMLGVASAVNYLNVQNNVATGRPGFQADGGDTNIGIQLLPKGNGDVLIYQSAGPVTLNASGGDANVDLNINAKGAGAIKLGSILSQAKVDFFKDVNGNVIVNLVGAASAVNYLDILNSAAGARLIVKADGSDTNIGLSLQPKGTGDVQIYQASGAATLSAGGGDANVDFNIAAKGAGSIKFGSLVSQARVDFLKDSSGNVILNFVGVASAVNYLDVTNNIATGRPGFTADGADTNIGLQFIPKGTGDFMIYQPSGGVTINANGNDADVDCNITTKGGGVLRANGARVSTSTRVINAQTGTSYTLALADAGGVVTLNNAAAVTLTVPPNSSVAFPVGAFVDFAQLGAGQVTFAPGAGVTLLSYPGLKIGAQYGGAYVVKLSTDTWLVTGLLSA